MDRTADRVGTFELCCPGMVDRIEIASVMSEVLDRKIVQKTTRASPPLKVPQGSALSAV